jgi:hypothetical protein
VIRPAEGKGQVVELVKAEPEKAAPGAPPPPPPAPNADWKIVQPAAWQADGFEARGLVEQVLNVRSRGRVQGNPDRAAFGLDKPRYTIEVTDKNNKTTTVSVGNRSALGNDLYVDVGDGQGVSMAAGGQLAGRLEGGTEKIFEAVRDKRLVTGVTTADVSHVEITPRRGDKLVLQKQGADWKVVAPKQVVADSGEVYSLLSAVTGLRAEEFVKPDSPEAGGAMIDQPRLTVVLSKDAPSTQPATGPATRPAGTATVAFGQYANIEKDKMYVKVSPAPDALAKVAVSEWTWDRIASASPLSLRDRKALDVDPERVERVVLSIDKPATTQPTAKPAEKRELVLERRREVLQQGPAAPAPASAPPKPAEKTSDATNALDEGEAVLASQEVKAEATAEPAAQQSAAKGQAAPAPAVATPSPEAATAPASKPTTATAPTTATTTPATAPAEPPSKWTFAAGDKKGDADDTKVQSLLDGLHPLRASKYLESAPTTPATGTYVVRIHTTAYGDQPAKVHELKLMETGSGTDAKVVGRYHHGPRSAGAAGAILDGALTPPTLGQRAAPAGMRTPSRKKRQSDAPPAGAALVPPQLGSLNSVTGRPESGRGRGTCRG